MEPHISSKFPRQQHSPTQCQRVWSHVSSAEIRVRIEIEFLVSLRASLRLYSTFNWKGLRALTKTWQKRRRSWPSETCWSCFTLLPVLLAVLAKFWDLTLTIWNEKGFLDPFIFRYKCIQMLAKHSLEFQAHQILMFQASVTFFQLSLAVNLQRHRKPMPPFHLTNRSRSAAKGQQPGLCNSVLWMDGMHQVC